MTTAAELFLAALTVAVGLSLVTVVLPRLLGARWIRLGGARWLALLIAPAVPAAGSLLLEATGAVVPGQLLSKSEAISVASGGEIDGGGGPHWSRALRYRVVFQPEGENRYVEMNVRTDSATFDALPSDGTIDVRYVRWFWGVATFARWTGESPWSFLWIVWEDDALRWWIVTVAVVGSLLVARPSTARRARRGEPPDLQRRRNLRSRARWLAAGAPFLIWAGLNVYSAFAGAPAPDSGWHRMQAQVRRVYEWKEHGYSFVELSLQAPDRAGPVVAVDTIDSSSSAALRSGQSVEVVYPPGNPRQARLTGVTRRSYRVDNLAVLAGVLALCLAVGFIAGWMRRTPPVNG
jgi:hypothetical protein